MSSGDHGAIKVDTCIYRRQNGRYAAKCRVGGRAGHDVSETFDTLKEARDFRDNIRRQAAENASNLGKSIKEQINSAPTSTVIRDGRKFTLRKLPEVLT